MSYKAITSQYELWPCRLDRKRRLRKRNESTSISKDEILITVKQNEKLELEVDHLRIQKIGFWNANKKVVASCLNWNLKHRARFLFYHQWNSGVSTLHQNSSFLLLNVPLLRAAWFVRFPTDISKYKLFARTSMNRRKNYFFIAKWNAVFWGRSWPCRSLFSAAYSSLMGGDKGMLSIILSRESQNEAF